MRNHRWTNDDDAALFAALDYLAPQKQKYEKLHRVKAFWDVVAGRLADRMCVTGAACKRRILTIKEIEQRKAKKAEQLKQAEQRQIDLTASIVKHREPMIAEIGSAEIHQCDGVIQSITFRIVYRGEDDE